MPSLPTRRGIARLLAAATTAPFTSGMPLAGEANPVAALERETGGRIGLYGLDTGNGRAVAFREAERFPICSTFKLLAAGLVLARVDRGEERLERRVAFKREAVVANSPVTERHAGESGGMTMAEICRAAITRSDNTAGNLMLDSFGGPPTLTAFLRSLGDETGRLDRRETALNEALPGDPRDTTSPAAMVGTARKLLLGEALSAISRRQLAEWLDANETGGARIRVACPPGWVVGDKTGTGERNAASDVAFLRPPGRAPLLLAIYTHASPKPLAELNAAIAAAARLALLRLG